MMLSIQHHAALAAIAAGPGATLMTTDRDFARLPGLAWKDPLSNESPPTGRK